MCWCNPSIRTPQCGRPWCQPAATPAGEPNVVPVAVPAGNASAVAQVEQLEAQLKLLPQVELHTKHVIHAGLYARTITIPAGVAITGARIKRATLLIVNGDAIVSGSGQPFRVTGYNVLPASAGRKTAWYAIEDTELTMLFPTSARTVEDAEREFTDEVSTLLSHRSSNEVLITQE